MAPESARPPVPERWREAEPIFAALGRELAARPLDAAGSCPSWSVVADWLLATGEPAGEWLALSLEPSPPERAQARAAELAAAMLPDRRVRGLVLEPPGWAPRQGPFVLAHVDWSSAYTSADALWSTLGVHGLLLPRDRVRLGPAWMNEVCAPGGPPATAHALVVPSLDALPTVEAAFYERAQNLPGHGHGPYIAKAGHALGMILPVLMPINPFPGMDPDEYQRSAQAHYERALEDEYRRSDALLLLAGVEDVERHAADWSRLQRLRRCVLAGTPELLARWPHRQRRFALLPEPRANTPPRAG